MQGYYFARPIPSAEFETLLSRGAAAFDDRFKDINLEGVAAFWDASAQTTLLFNSFLGGAAIMEYRNGVLEASRVNDNFYKTLGTTRQAYSDACMNVLARFDEENAARMMRTIECAIASGEECGCEVESLPGAGVTRLWTSNRMRLLAKSIDSVILYIAIEDITERKLLERAQAAERERDHLLMQTTGISFFEYDTSSGIFTFQYYNPNEGIVSRKYDNYHSFVRDGQIIYADSAPVILRFLDEAVRAPTRGEFEFRANHHRTGMRWYRARYVSVADSEGRVYRLIGQIDDIQDIKDRAMIAESLRMQIHGSAPIRKFNETVVNQIIALFYDSSKIAEAIDTALALLGEYFDLSRAYIFEDNVDHTCASNTFEWCAPGIKPERDRLQNVPYEQMGGRDEYYAKFDENGSYYCPDIHFLSPGERDILEPQGIHSMLHCAILDNGVLSGLIGFDECRENRRWTEEQTGTLMFVSRMIAAHLLRLRQADGSMFSLDFREALDDNSAYTYVIDPENYRIIFANRAYREKFGGGDVGKTCHESITGRTEACDVCPMRLFRDTGKLTLAKIRRKDGVMMFAHASMLRWNGRELAMLSCVNMDSTIKD